MATTSSFNKQCFFETLWYTSKLFVEDVIVATTLTWPFSGICTDLLSSNWADINPDLLIIWYVNKVYQSQAMERRNCIRIHRTFFLTPSILLFLGYACDNNGAKFYQQWIIICSGETIVCIGNCKAFMKNWCPCIQIHLQILVQLWPGEDCDTWYIDICSECIKSQKVN